MACAPVRERRLERLRQWRADRAEARRLEDTRAEATGAGRLLNVEITARNRNALEADRALMTLASADIRLVVWVMNVDPGRLLGALAPHVPVMYGGTLMVSDIGAGGEAARPASDIDGQASRRGGVDDASLYRAGDGPASAAVRYRDAAASTPSHPISAASDHGSRDAPISDADAHGPDDGTGSGDVPVPSDIDGQREPDRSVHVACHELGRTVLDHIARLVEWRGGRRPWVDDVALGEKGCLPDRFYGTLDGLESTRDWFGDWTTDLDYERPRFDVDRFVSGMWTHDQTDPDDRPDLLRPWTPR